MEFDKTRKLLDKFEKMPFDYNGCINAQVDIIKSIIYGAGNSGFSASCVGMETIKSTHGIKGPFMIIKLEDMLYPQCLPEPKVAAWINENEAWIGKKARKLLRERKGASVHPNVLAHWKSLSKLRKKRSDAKGGISE